MTTKPEIGDFFVVRTHGFVADAICWCCQSDVNHAGWYIGDGKLLEGEPNGASIHPLGHYGDAKIWSTGKIDLPDEVRQGVPYVAQTLVGAKYSYWGIVCIGLAQRRLGSLMKSDNPIAKKVSDDGDLFCSQLVDYGLELAGYHLFRDGRLPGLVSPGDLHDLIR